MAKSSSPNSGLVHDLMKVCEALEERYGRRKHAKSVDFIEALVFQVLELGVGEKAARDALKRIHEEYVDWNDMRVATVREIEDVLGPKYYRVREKAEDLINLLRDLYTAFRRMNLAELPPEGIETLRSLPDTTNVRKDFVERTLLLMLDVKIFPCDIEGDQIKLLKFLGGVPKPLTLQQGLKKVEESLDNEQMLRLSRGLREHMHVINSAGESEPQIIAFQWGHPDPLKMDKKKK